MVRTKGRTKEDRRRASAQPPESTLVYHSAASTYALPCRVPAPVVVPDPEPYPSPQHRLDCTLGSAALMRQAYVQALNHARTRSAFGARLVDQPLMLNLLADLAIESEAATRLAMRMAKAFDDEDDHLSRIGGGHDEA